MDYLSLIQAFAPHFSTLVWEHAQVLVLSAILVPGRRTVTAVLRIMGLSTEKQFQTYHRVLNRAAWSSWTLSRRLLGLLIQMFVSRGQSFVVWTIRSSDVGERRSRPKARFAVAIRCGRAIRTL
jgi:DDE superfamily endonuclease